jgi:2-polyprenyl-3-methyl-5-hydroxy-6-metoxy-1,4-benzoquinol methylase
MLQSEQSKINKAAWSYRAYEWWEKKSGNPREAAQLMLSDPKSFLRRHYEYFEGIEGKKIANLLGSSGRIAIPLAILGGEVTVVDISPENHTYAVEVAEEAGVNINYVVSDLMELELGSMKNSFDVVYMEGGILHYFTDLHQLAEVIFELLDDSGRLILNDFHPIRKVLKPHKDSFILEGDYFKDELFYGDVAYKGMFPEEEQVEFPDCLLRFWNLGEIITAMASKGLVIKMLIEEPRSDSNSFLPGSFTLVADKMKYN